MIFEEVRTIDAAEVNVGDFMAGVGAGVGLAGIVVAIILVS